MIVSSQTNVGAFKARDIYKRARSSKVIQYSLIALGVALIIRKVF